MAQSRFHYEEATAVRRAVLFPGQLQDWVPAACAVVAEHLRHHGIAPNGFPFARCHPLLDGVVEVEAGFPVAAPIADSGLVGPSTLPAGPVLAVWHNAPDRKIAESYQVVDEWLAAEGATPTGDSWEIYHDLPSCDHLGTRIEIVQPIAFTHACPTTVTRRAAVDGRDISTAG
ncbi:hypothetical protein [Kribbella sp. NPDC004875]|uniref:hypothetical protein n=1 Tax=Kribbella sp. NPDC004875 TaxID=3364107 RepID=UPI00369B6EA4